MTPALLLAAALALAGPGPPPEAAAGAPPPAYSFAVRLTLSDAARRATYTHYGSGTFNAPPVPGATARIGAQAAEAYAEVLGRMFQPASGGAGDLELAVEMAGADVEWRIDGWRAVVSHALVLREVSGAAVGRWSVRGDAPIGGLGAGAIPAAFAVAARSAAARFRLAFAELPEVARWLEGRGLQVVPPPPPPPELVDRGPPPAGPRPPRVAFVDLGLAWDHRGRVPGVVAGIRGGVSNGWGLVQLGLGRWDAPAPTSLANPEGTVRTQALGLDLGALLRPWQTVEVVGGVGAVVVLSGGAGSSEDLLPTFFVSVRSSQLFAAAGVRFRFAVEGRQYGAGSYLRSTLGLVVGMELPLGRSPD